MWELKRTDTNMFCGELTLDTVGGEEGDVASFQGVVMGTVR